MVTGSINVVEALDQLDDCALSRARWAHDGSGFTSLKGPGEVLEDVLVWSAWVVEVDLVKFDLSVDIKRHTLVNGDLWLFVNNVKSFLIDV